ncbi:Ppx/GppA phosphatase family protein [Bounagaea algeriensis]
MARVAAIDCGTNSIRLLIADVAVTGDGRRELRDVQREMRIVRLGQGVDASGRLADEAIERTRLALVDYAEAARQAGAERVRMVATSATRDAANRDDFFGMVRSTLGVDAEVVTGQEEAQLSFTGAVSAFDPSGSPFAVTDVGGGSTELVLGTWDGAQARVQASYSADIGCVRLTERCLPSDPATADEVAEAEKVARSVLDEAFAAVDASGAHTWIGVAGTVTTLSALAMGLEEYDSVRIHRSSVPREGIERLTGDLLRMQHSERAALGPMHPGRVDVIGGGSLVVKVLADEFAERAGIAEMAVSEQDILDGIALSLV